MPNIRRGYELRGLFLGRPIRPFHFAVTIATTVIAVALLETGTMDWFPHSVVHVVGAFSLMASVFLSYGWWFRNDTAAEWGLLIACGVWVSRAFYALIGGEGLLIANQWTSFFLSIAWAVGAGGAYLLERYDHQVSELDE
jgi:hypothetical protein